MIQNLRASSLSLCTRACIGPFACPSKHIRANQGQEALPSETAKLPQVYSGAQLAKMIADARKKREEQAAAATAAAAAGPGSAAPDAAPAAAPAPVRQVGIAMVDECKDGSMGELPSVTNKLMRVARVRLFLWM